MTAPIVSAAEPDAVAAVVTTLREGLVVALPTDTVYGLAADPARPGAIDRLFAAKERPRNVELPVLVADEAQARALADVSPEAGRLMARWWPGALTLVLPRRAGLAWDLGERRSTIGLRCPGYGFVREVCASFGPIATTSANRHGGAPLTSAGAVRAEMGDAVELIVDGGTCDRPPSTVVDATAVPLRVLREGALSPAAIGIVN